MLDEAVAAAGPSASMATSSPHFWSGDVRNHHPPLISYVILSEFNIDTGSTVKHQYPEPIADYTADWFAENMLPEGAHNRDSDYTVMFLNRKAPHVDEAYWLNPLQEQPTTATTNFLYGLNLVRTKHDVSVRRGAVVKAMAVFSCFQWIEVLKPVLEQSLERYFANPSIDVLAELFSSLNAIDLTTMPRPTTLEQIIMRRNTPFSSLGSISGEQPQPPMWTHLLPLTLAAGRERGGEAADAAAPSIKFTLTVPLHLSPDEVGDISLTRLVKTFGDATMRIFHAVLRRQRILFVGYSHSALDLAQFVLSTVAMVAPALPNVIRRTYPYANLTDLSFLEVGLLLFTTITLSYMPYFPR